MTIVNKANPTDAEIREEMASEFADYFAKPQRGAFLDECVKIASFLANAEQVKQELKVLEAKLSATVARNLNEVAAHYERRVRGDQSVLDARLKHLLSNELTAMEVQWGFNSFECVGSNTGRVQTYVGFLDSKTFLQQVSLGRHWKDPGVPNLHGEYTHRLQWYLLSNHVKALAKAPVKLFMQIGEVLRGNDERGLWAALFDRDGGEDALNPFKIDSHVADCRAPESFTRLVIDDKNAAEWPFLHWYIRARLRKRVGTNNYFATREYVQRKLQKFGVTDVKPDAIVGQRRAFEKSTGGIRRIEAGKPIVRTPDAL
jgi:hypothetical protein